jgi:hypothetical protein
MQYFAALKAEAHAEYTATAGGSTDNAARELAVVRSNSQQWLFYMHSYYHIDCISA